MRAYYTFMGLLVVCFIACQSNPAQIHSDKKPQPKATKTVSSEEDRVVNMIMDLDEVKHKNAVVERLSKGKSRLSTYIATPPTSDAPNYWIKVAEDNGSNYVTYYTFTVNSKTHLIKYYDVVQDSLLTINEWRQSTPVQDR